MRAFSESDTAEDLERIDVPVLTGRRVQAERPEKGGHVLLHGGLADVQRLGDAGVGPALRHRGQDGELAGPRRGGRR